MLWAVLDSGYVFTWGNGEDGQLGLGNTESQYLPARLNIFGKDVLAKGISCSARYSVVHTDDGSLFVWGALGSEVQGPVSEPHKVPAAQRRQGASVTSVSCSNRHILVLSGGLVDDGLFSFFATPTCFSSNKLTSVEAGVLCQWGPTSSISLHAAKSAFSGRMLNGRPVRFSAIYESVTVELNSKPCIFSRRPLASVGSTLLRS